MNVLDTRARPVIGPGFRLQWESAQNAHVLLYPEGMVKLNATAAAILTRCDGERSLADIVAELEQAYSMAGLQDQVCSFVTLAMQNHWLELSE